MAAQNAAGGNLANLSQHTQVTAEDWAKNPSAARSKRFSVRPSRCPLWTRTTATAFVLS
jgi:hypothetical protein